MIRANANVHIYLKNMRYLHQIEPSGASLFQWQWAAEKNSWLIFHTVITNGGI